MEENLLILANAYAILCDPGDRGGRYSLLIRDGRIGEIVESIDQLLSRYPSATVLDASEKLVIPGFVNAHFHSDSVLLRAATEGKRFRDWQRDAHVQSVSELLMNSEGHEVLQSTYLSAYAGHLKSGTTCVGEFPPAVDGSGLQTILDAIDQTGLRAVVALQNWDQIEHVRNQDGGGARFQVSLGLVEDFTVYTFDTMVRTAEELQSPLLAHCAELPDDGEYVRKNFRRSLLELLREYNALHSDTVLVHLNHITPRDLAIIKETATTTTLCIRSAARKRTGYPSLRLFRSHEPRLCLGTDWGAMDMIEEMRFVNQLSLLLPGIPEFSPLQLLRMATINGAVGLGVSAETGSIETGKNADLLLMSLQDIRLSSIPRTPTAASLADLLLNSPGVQHKYDVILHGKFVVRDGMLTELNEEDLITRLREMEDKSFPPELHQGRHTKAERRDQKGKQTTLSGGSEDMLTGTPDQPAEQPDEKMGEAGQPDAASRPVQKTPQARPGQTGGLGPELPKNVRRVFGDDDDV